MASLSPQNHLLVSYMLAGRKLTNQIALVNLGVASVTSRIAELKGLGYSIAKEERKDHFGSRYVEYSMTADAA